MSGVSALDLARIQFGFTISFHIVFPAITIGLASYRYFSQFAGSVTGPLLTYPV